MTAVIVIASGVVGMMIGFLTALITARDWTDKRFRSLNECDERHNRADERHLVIVARIDCLEERLSAQIDGLARDVHQVSGSWVRLDERLIAGLRRLDEVIAHLSQFDKAVS